MRTINSKINIFAILALFIGISSFAPALAQAYDYYPNQPYSDYSYQNYGSTYQYPYYGGNYYTPASQYYSTGAGYHGSYQNYPYYSQYPYYSNPVSYYTQQVYPYFQVQNTPPYIPYNYPYYPTPTQHQYPPYHPYPTNAPLSVSCYPDPSSIRVGNYVTWRATATGGSHQYTFVWNGEGISTNSYTGSSITTYYHIPGQKTVSVTVESAGNRITKVCGPVYVMGY